MTATAIVTALIGVALITTLVLPGRATAPAIDAVFTATAGLLKTSRGA
jgi:hypothetical protein